MNSFFKQSAQRSSTIPHRIEQGILALLLLSHLALGFLFSTIPVREATEEIKHFRFIAYLLENHSLPDARTEPYGQFHQAPLYYAVMLPVTVLSGDVTLPDWQANQNPFYGASYPQPGNDNNNVYLHPATDLFPSLSEPVARAIRLLRWQTLLMGLMTLIIIYETARLLWSDRAELRLIAVGAAAFQPMFVYLNSTVSNDALLFLMCSMALLLVLRQEIEGPSTRLALWLGLVLGAALLSKASAGFLIFPVGFATLLRLRRNWRHAAITLGITVLLAGWWYGRNLLMYGDLTGARPVLGPWGAYTNDGAFLFSAMFEIIPYAYRSFWAQFGYGGVSVPPYLFTVFDILTASFGIGILAAGVKAIRTQPEAIRDRHRLYPWLIVGVFALTWIVQLMYFSGVAWFGNQGRYVLPGIGALALLVSAGFWALPERWYKPLGAMTIGFLAAISTLIVARYVLPAYSPGPYTEPAQPLAYTYGDLITLHGITPEVASGAPGEWVAVSLHWEAIAAARPEQDIRIYLHSLEDDLVRRDSYPATGNLLATDWEPGQRWVDRFWIRIPPDATAQRSYTLVAGVYDAAINQPLVPTISSGEAVDVPVVGRLAVHGPLDPGATTVTHFGYQIGLIETTLNPDPALGSLEICAVWTALAGSLPDYHVFFHVVSTADGQILDQRDIVPLGGQYPTTVWQAGEPVTDCVRFEEVYWLDSHWEARMGFYDLKTGMRLTVETSQEGQTDYVTIDP